MPGQPGGKQDINRDFKNNHSQRRDHFQGLLPGDFVQQPEVTVKQQDIEQVKEKVMREGTVPVG